MPREQYMRDEDLAAFAAKVQSLRDQGLAPGLIADRLGIHRNTMNERLRRHRALEAAQKKT